MKTQYLAAGLLLFLYLQGQSQKSTSCCQASSIQAFTDLAKDVAFVITHEEPLPFTLQNPRGKNITFPVLNELEGKGYYVEGKKGNHQWIFVFQEWWGLNDYIRQQCDILHSNFPEAHILALDLYDGQAATTREQAAALMQGSKPERIEKIIAGASQFAGPNSRIATIGWCFGGAWSHKAAVLLGNKVTACIIYYGMPVTDEMQLNKLTAPVLGIFADNDGWITPKVVEDFKLTMDKLHKSIEVHSYKADHAFANPSNPKFEKNMADDAWTKSIAFLKKHL